MSPNHQIFRFERLDALADEASYLNNYSLNESLSSDVYAANTSTNVEDNILQEPISGTKAYLKCLSHYRKKYDETEPLLPIHIPPNQSPADLIPCQPESGLNPYFNIITEFIWSYVFTDNIRSFMRTYSRQLLVTGVLIAAGVGVILYLTDNLEPFLYYFKRAYCLILNDLAPGSTWTTICVR